MALSSLGGRVAAQPEVASTATAGRAPMARPACPARRDAVVCRASGAKEVTLLDYGAGNIRSVRNAIKKLGYTIKDVSMAAWHGRGRRSWGRMECPGASMARVATAGPNRRGGGCRRGAAGTGRMRLGEWVGVWRIGGGLVASAWWGAIGAAGPTH